MSSKRVIMLDNDRYLQMHEGDVRLYYSFSASGKSFTTNGVTIQNALLFAILEQLIAGRTTQQSASAHSKHGSGE